MQSVDRTATPDRGAADVDAAAALGGRLAAAQERVGEPAGDKVNRQETKRGRP